MVVTFNGVASTCFSRQIRSLEYWHNLHKKIERSDMTYCPICIKPQQHFENELSFDFDRFTSTLDQSIHQILHYQIISITIHHFRIEPSESIIPKNQLIIHKNDFSSISVQNNCTMFENNWGEQYKLGWTKLIPEREIKQMSDNYPISILPIFYRLLTKVTSMQVLHYNYILLWTW